MKESSLPKMCTVPPSPAHSHSQCRGTPTLLLNPSLTRPCREKEHRNSSAARAPSLGYFMFFLSYYWKQLCLASVSPTDLSVLWFPSSWLLVEGLFSEAGG